MLQHRVAGRNEDEVEEGRGQQAAESDDVAVIRKLTEELGRASEAFAARRMDKSIKQALSGVSLEELDQEVSE